MNTKQNNKNIISFYGDKYILII